MRAYPFLLVFPHPPGDFRCDLMHQSHPRSETRSQSFGEEVVRRILLGSFVLSRECVLWIVFSGLPPFCSTLTSLDVLRDHRSYQSYYVQAQRVRRMVAEDFKAVFGKSCDLLLTPVTTGVAPLLADIQKQDPLESYAQDVFTVPASLAGKCCAENRAAGSGESLKSSRSPPPLKNLRKQDFLLSRYRWRGMVHRGCPLVCSCLGREATRRLCWLRGTP